MYVLFSAKFLNLKIKVKTLKTLYALCKLLKTKNNMKKQYEYTYMLTMSILFAYSYSEKATLCKRKA